MPYADGLNLNVTTADNALDLDLAREVAPYFRLNVSEAETIIENFSSIVAQWRVVAGHLGLSLREQEKMSDAFRLAAAHSA